ncbi:class I SAM-dependent methyltransferase [Candidatus Sumerlaeota bacterium]|nr:class I SAM-dependent methyltransferase [Candidatus Sumerlaeota bacterium]
MSDRYYANSKVEIRGILARHYDFLLDFITLGSYATLLKKAIEFMEIHKTDKILDLGCGTGRNACLMNNYLSDEGFIVGIDISQIMIRQFIKKCNNLTNVYVLFSRADETLPFRNEVFDKVLVSFLLHGFPQNVRESIIEEIYRVLKPTGKLFILDYNQFTFEESPLHLRLLFRLLECSYAFDFIKRDWKEILFSKEFTSFREKLFFKNYVRILEVKKR